jgi:hypothetical protein
MKTKHNKILFFLIILGFAWNFSLAQSPMHADSLLKQNKIHSPKRAAVFSAVIPGLGQTYNKKYWKVPIIYAGLGGSAYFFYANNQDYKIFRNELQARFLGDTEKINPKLVNYSEQNLVSLKNYYQRNRELSVLVAVVVYALNILDASVDAHLFSFDVSDDLSLSIQPYSASEIWHNQDLKMAYSSGITLRLKF